MANRIQIRRDTAANWTSVNPVLASGEEGLETDTGNRKLGDGVTAWASLGYQAPNAATLSATYVPLASRGAASGVASLDSGSKVPTAQIPDLSSLYIPIATGNNPGLHVNTPSPTYGTWFTFGNAPGSMGFAGNGSPPEAWAPWIVYQKFGDYTGGTNAAVTKTTQAAAILASYYGPCADDAAEAFSSFVGLKNTGTAFAHTKPTVAIEGIAQIEGSNTAMGGDAAPLLGIGSRVIIQSTAHVATSANFKATTNSTGGPTFGTSDKHIAFWQPTPAAANGGTFTKAYGVYVCDPINSEGGYTLGASGYTGQAWILANGGADTGTSFAFFQAPSTANLTTMTLRAATGQSKSILQAVDSGGTTRFQVSFAGSVNQTSQSYNWQNSSSVSQVVIAGNSSNGTITLAGGVNFILDTTTGSKIGTVGGASGQKIGFFGAAPVIQQLLATGASHTVDDIITTLQTLGLVRQT
ncbi:MULTISPECIES: hypothetical protein [Arthrobacter]|uniref:Major tropism determinant N-terminal domain-containing protein n=1 Tax=Arthrobacter terricola TaxID=2547396 RepID=A0A4R5KMU0_9MICC|nr:MULTISPECIES: hypothetical protein [Arthrobacter]MBT8160983.1 hypothetical protein [Arthrobacter sp. GN70]TDF96846.1 hypothetical protein E1809_08980 [Arthrobacter terricola]